MALPPSKRSRLHLGNGHGDASSSSTIPIGIFVTQESFEEIKALMSHSTNFAAFYAAAMTRQTSHSSERDAGDTVNEKMLSLAPAVRKIQDCGALFTAAQYSSKLFADLEESYQALSKAFEVPLVVEFRTMSGQLIHTLSESVDWVAMRKMTVKDIEGKFSDWIGREARNLKKDRDEYMTRIPNVVRTMSLENDYMSSKLLPVLFEERTQRHIDQAGREKGHCKKPCAKHDYLFRLVMAYNDRDEPQLLYAGHFHRGDSVHPSRLDVGDDDYWPTLDLVELPVHEDDEDDGRLVELGGNRTSIELKPAGRTTPYFRRRLGKETIRFDGSKGAIALTKRCFAAIGSARERVKDIHARITEQFPTLQTLQTLRQANRDCRLKLVQGTEELSKRTRIAELVDGCSLRQENRMVLSWTVVVTQSESRGQRRQSRSPSGSLSDANLSLSEAS